MGKIRIKAIGDEAAEKQQKEEARKRAEAKRAAKQEGDTAEKVNEQKKETVEAASRPEEVKTREKSKYAAKKTKAKHSQKYLSIASLVDSKKLYSVSEALELLPKLQKSKLDETVELHINTIDKGISGSVTLPHGTGKKMKVTVVNYAKDPKSAEELIKKVEGGIIEFDILIATPDSMPKLAKVARFLGPRGLMPNPKNGTVTAKPEEEAKKYEGGQMNYKTESKFPILHLSVGKVSFGSKKLAENIKTALEAVQMKNIKNITLKSTMSPGLKLDQSNLA